MPDSPAPTLPAPSNPVTDLDLSAEASRFLRTRRSLAIAGVGTGLVFLGIGTYAVLRLAKSGLSAEFVIGVLLLGLGAVLAVVTLRNGLLNPVTSLRLDAEGITYVRRWWGPVRRKWSRPGLLLVVEDLGPDTISSPEEKEHLFFTGPGPVYGSLPVGRLGPFLDRIRDNGLSVSMRTVQQATGQVVHRVRRIRIVQGVAD